MKLICVNNKVHNKMHDEICDFIKDKKYLVISVDVKGQYVFHVNDMNTEEVLCGLELMKFNHLCQHYDITSQF